MFSRLTQKGALILVSISCLGCAWVTAPAMASSESEYVISFEKDVGVSQQNQVLAGLDLNPEKYVKLINADVIKATATEARALATTPGVRYVEAAKPVSIAKVPNDTRYQVYQWNLWDTYGIHAENAWDVQTGTSNVVVATTDTGVDYNHPDLNANLWRNPGESGNGKETNDVDDDGDGIVDDVYGANFVNGTSGDPADNNGHGTHVAGIIGASTNNSMGVAGINWNTRIMALKFLAANGTGNTADAVSAINYAVAHGAKVINASWSSNSNSQALHDAIHAAGNAGVLFVAAAGNGGNDSLGDNNDSAPVYPATFDEANIISVASTDVNGNLSSFSNYGVNSVDVAAPGENIMSTWPNNSYASKSGTSMATPHVAGISALLMASNSTTSMTDIKATILGNTRALPSLQGKVLTGGLVDAAAALGNPRSENDEIASLAINNNTKLTNNVNVSSTISLSSPFTFNDVQVQDNAGAWKSVGSSLVFSFNLTKIDGVHMIKARLMSSGVSIGKTNLAKIILDTTPPEKFKIKSFKIKAKKTKITWSKAKDLTSSIKDYKVSLYLRKRSGTKRLAKKTTTKTSLVFRQHRGRAKGRSGLTAQQPRIKAKYRVQVCARDLVGNQRCISKNKS